MPIAACQEMKANGTQCTVRPYCTVNGVMFCRLHLSFKSCRPEMATAKIVALNTEDQEDCEHLISVGQHTKHARPAAAAHDKRANKDED